MDAVTSFAKDEKDAKPLDIEVHHTANNISKHFMMFKMFFFVLFQGYNKFSLSEQEVLQKVPNIPVIFKNWQRPTSLHQLYQALEINKEKTIRLVVGNTGTGKVLVNIGISA